MSVISVYAVFANDEEAARIGRRMIEERLAACVNILGPVRSFYRWQGQIDEGDEVAAIFKTTGGESELLIRRIGELHSYDVPCITVWPIDKLLGNYAEWVEACVG